MEETRDEGAPWRGRFWKRARSSFERELSGVYNKNAIMEMYKEATREPYSFLFVRLDAKTRETMFHIHFEDRLVPEDVD